MRRSASLLTRGTDGLHMRITRNKPPACAKRIFMKLLSIAAAAGFALTGTAAFATPGLDEKVYGATVEKGVSEVELRYGRSVGGEAGGEDATVVELSHGFSDRFYGGVLFG